ncbi:aldolase [Paenibacillus methanolicus]|uniref:HPr serine kinase-like protein n=1 Tax=Paenibacillus methanolicus TaxID=582686 RepID=A0A5S5CC02_9BACL|nr:aldolase [Paenibacillus methanolicus]TYP76689.1 HPr serine kinase-like protein [Paenibacillus methanolicus]
METNIRQRKVYESFGLRIASEIELPELLPGKPQEPDWADVDIRLEDLEQVWREHEAPEDYYAFLPDRLLFYVPDIAIFSVSGGREIRVSPLPGSEETARRLYVLGTCMGTILIQRKTLPLHGSAVLIDGRAYAIVGDSGAGKSTLAKAFVERGHMLLSDDVIAVSQDGPHGHPVVQPAYPQQKLWQQSLDRFGLDGRSFETLYETKYAVPVRSRFCAEPMPLAGVFELAKAEEEEIELAPYTGLAPLPVLRMHTFRQFLIPQFGEDSWHFRAIARLAGQIPVYRLRRPAGPGFTAYELVDRIRGAVSGS